MHTRKYTIALQIFNLEQKLKKSCHVRKGCGMAGLNTCSDKKKIINSYSPTVGAVAIHDIYAPYCHVSVVSNVSSGNVTIDEANYSSCKFTTRTGSPSALKIIGYFKP